jgi:hypothetical protein
MNFTPQHYYIVIGHMLYNPRFCKDASANLQSEWFTSEPIGCSYWCSAAFSTIQAYFERYKVPPDQPAFKAEIFALAQRFLNPYSPEAAAFQNDTENFVHVFMPTVTDSSAKLAKALYDHMIRTCRFDAQAKALIEEAQRNQNSDNFLSELSKRSTALDMERSRAFSAPSTAFNPFEKVEQVPRVLSGVDFLDVRVGGGRGLVQSAAMGLVAPGGGGKTTLGNQIVIAQAMMGKPAIMAIAEQGMDADYRRNVLACATGLSTNTLLDHGDDVVKAAIAMNLDRDITMDRLQKLQDNVKFVDLVNAHDGDLTSVETAIEIAATSGDGRFRIAYFDWAGAMGEMAKARKFRGNKWETDDLRGPTSFVAAWAAELAQKYNICIVLSHQMSGDAAKKGAFFDFDQYCGADSRTNFQVPLRYFVTIGPRDSRTGRQILGVPKARNDRPLRGNDRVVLRHTGEFASFEEAKDYSVSNGRIACNTVSTNKHSVPKE